MAAALSDAALAGASGPELLAAVAAAVIDGPLARSTLTFCGALDGGGHATAAAAAVFGQAAALLEAETRLGSAWC